MKPTTKNSATHPFERFVAPGSMEKGVPLAAIIGLQAIELIAESMVSVAPRFNAKQFRTRAEQGLEGLGIMQRGAHVAQALAEQLPPRFEEAAEVLIASLGPEQQATAGNGMAPFFYLPHSCFIAAHGGQDFASGMRACYELTKRFTAEFCLRPLLVQHQAKGLKLLQKWAKDPSPHVRRLVSEGTRPRLPWGMRLRAFQDDPTHTLALLERLKDDPELYVQRSVANHLGDILKDNPSHALDVCERWVKESESPRLSGTQANARRWIVRHAVRLPAKKGDAVALQLRARAKAL